MNDRRRVLLTVSGVIPIDLARKVASGERPRADYEVMRTAFDADLVDENVALAYTGFLGHLIRRLFGLGALLGWFCFRHRRVYDLIVTDGEQVGLPLALLSRMFGRGSAQHMMLVHILSTRSKVQIIRLARLAPLVDRYVVYCSRQRDFIVSRFSVPVERVMLSTFMVDTSFFRPDRVDVVPDNLICAAGLERRDYPTLIEAVDGLGVRVVIAAASPWSTEPDSTANRVLPPNVEICRLSLFELRELYARSRFIVMPLVEVEFQAGITTILEAMSMGRAVICTRTPGQSDTIIDGVTGQYVPPADSDALRSAISGLLDDDTRALAMGVAARSWVQTNADIEVYAHRLAVAVQDLLTLST